MKRTALLLLVFTVLKPLAARGPGLAKSKAAAGEGAVPAVRGPVLGFVYGPAVPRLRSPHGAIVSAGPAVAASAAAGGTR